MISYERFNEIQDIIDDISYKPGWKFRVKQSGMDTYLVLSMRVPNTWSRARESIEIGQSFMLPSTFLGHAFHRDDFLDWVRMAIVTLEKHEIDENLRFRGNFVNHPHPEAISA